MRLRTATSGALICAAATAAALTLAAPAAPAPPTHYVRVGKCDKLTRSAAFVGRMRAVRGTERMWMRFTLFERVLPSREFEEVAAPGLGVWHRSRPGVRRFSYRQRVRGLAEAAVYRTLVEFRWYDEEEQLLRKTLARSGRCRQPGTLPNLRVQNIGYRPAQGRYSVRVANVGDDVATGGGVKLFVDGNEAGTVSLPDVPAGETRSVQIAGPACEGFVQAVADPAATVRESSENDNARTESCSELPPG